MTEQEIKIARAITAQMDGILCPICSDVKDTDSKDKQKLSAYGDFEEQLFCPHCDMDIKIIVSNTGGRTLWN